MYSFTFRFYGRSDGAMGVDHECMVTVVAESHDAALLRLYDTHEHVHSARLIRKEPV